MCKKEMKAYMGFMREAGAPEGACLIFAHTIREAKKLACPVIISWGTDFIDVGVRLLRNSDHLFVEGDQDKLAKDIPHIIEEPTCCKRCLLWGHPINEDGLCESCAEDEMN